MECRLSENECEKNKPYKNLEERKFKLTLNVKEGYLYDYVSDDLNKLFPIKGYSNMNVFVGAQNELSPYNVTDIYIKFKDDVSFNEQLIF